MIKRFLLKAFFWSLALSLSTTALATQHSWQPFEFRQTVSGFLTFGLELHLNGEQSLVALDENHWRFSLQAKTWGAKFEESCEVEWDGQRFYPKKYQKNLTGWAVPNTIEVITFSEEKGIQSNIDGSKASLPYSKDVWDPLCFTLQVIADYQTDLNQLEYAVFNGERTRVQVFARTTEPFVLEQIGGTKRGRTVTIKLYSDSLLPKLRLELKDGKPHSRFEFKFKN